MDDEHTKSLYSPSIPILFFRMQFSVSRDLSKRIHSISQRVHRQPAARNIVRSKKSRATVQRRTSRTVFKTNKLEATKKSTFLAERIIAHKINFAHATITLCLEMEQFVLVPLCVSNSSNNPTIVTKQELSKYNPEQTPTYHKNTLQKEINQQLSTSAYALINKILESPRFKLSNSNTLILCGTETGRPFKDFSQRLKRTNVPIHDFYFTLLDRASITLDFVINRHSKGKEKGAWIVFKK